MKAYFTQLFSYDRYANQLILETTGNTNNKEMLIKLMGHLLAAQQIWLSRCKGLPAMGIELWPDLHLDTLSGLITENSTAWLSYVDGLQSGDFEKLISYKSIRGDSFENKLTDILAHVINHGTHHRAQAGQHLKEAGIDLPITDYIFYLRQSIN